MKKPTFKKVDNNTIQIIVEKATNIQLIQIVENKKKLLAQKAQIEDTLKNLEEILVVAKKLKITAKTTKTNVIPIPTK